MAQGSSTMSSPESAGPSAVSPGHDDLDWGKYHRGLKAAFRRAAGEVPFRESEAVLLESGVLLRWNVDILDVNGQFVQTIRVNGYDESEARGAAAKLEYADRLIGRAVPFRRAAQT